MAGVTVEHPISSDNGVRVAQRIVFIVVLVEFAVLAATGLALVFLYQPTARSWWDALASGSAPGVLQFVHRIVAHAVLLTMLAQLLLAGLDSTRRRRSRPARAASLAAVITLIATLVMASGYLLPWEQLALSAVSAADNLRGFGPIFDQRARFVLIGNIELSRGTAQAWFVVHMVAGVGLIAVVSLTMRRWLKRPPEQS
jgi:quinol-cytochrome oxidoreductase complex cytochrome b subunit